MAVFRTLARPRTVKVVFLSEAKISSSDFTFIVNIISQLVVCTLAFSVDGASFGVLRSGGTELVLLLGLMKSLRSLSRFSFEYLRSAGPDLRRRVSLRSLFLFRRSAGPGRPLIVSLRSSDHF